MAKKKPAYLTIPYGIMWHIFDETDRSLCGKAMMLVKNDQVCEAFTGEEKWSKGLDCKTCFRKAGLIEEKKE